MFLEGGRLLSKEVVSLSRSLPGEVVRPRTCKVSRDKREAKDLLQHSTSKGTEKVKEDKIVTASQKKALVRASRPSRAS